MQDHQEQIFTMANRARQHQAADDVGRLANILENAFGQLNGGRNQQFKAQKYDECGDVELFIQGFTDVAQANNWDQQAANLNIRLCLEKSAQECAWGDTVEVVIANLRARFGMTMRQARDKLATIRKEFGKNFHSFGVDIMKLVRIAHPTMGANLQQDLAVETVKRCI